ncbi:MAG: metallophosphoesterase family protein, partial [Anaerolineae bacterium]
MTKRHITPSAVFVSIAALLLIALSGIHSMAAQTPLASIEADPVLVGAGDIASCSSSGDEATANLLDTIPGTVFTAGDNVYESGTATEFANCYDPSWGRHKSRTRPSPGNHDYNTAGASGYYDYFGAAAGNPSQGYYAYDLGTWHIIVLNSEIAHGAGSAQEQWLRSDLAAHSNTCTLAYWHRPRFSSGFHGNITSLNAFWLALHEYGADVVVNGHDHDYERFAPQNPSGVADPTYGLREFVVGTGGRSLTAFSTIQGNSEVRDSSTYGVLKLTLHPTSYDWVFVPQAGGAFTDSGNASCHGSPTAPTPTHTPTDTPTNTPTPTSTPTPTPLSTPVIVGTPNATPLAVLAIINWQTNVDADSRVRFRDVVCGAPWTRSVTQAAQVIVHSVV